MRKKERLIWIDIAKFVAILAVVMNHLPGAGARYVVYTIFSVSLFFMVSGFTSSLEFYIKAEKFSLLSYYKSKIVKIFIPYAIATTIYHVYANRQIIPKQLLHNIVSFRVAGPFYFLIILFQLLFIAPFLYKIFLRFQKKSGVQVVLLIIIYGLSQLSEQFVVIPAALGDRYLFGGSYLFLYTLGMVWQINKDAMGKGLEKQVGLIKIQYYVVLIFVGAIASLAFLGAFRNRAIWSNPPNNYAITYTVCIFGLIYLTFRKRMLSLDWIQKATDIFLLPGKYSLYVFLYHTIILNIIISNANPDLFNPLIYGSVLILLLYTPVVCYLGIHKICKWLLCKGKKLIISERTVNTMPIMPNRMDRGFLLHQEEYEQKALAVLRSGWYVLGKEVEAFEKEFAAYTGANHCVGVANGLDALWMAFRILGIGEGDEVLVQGNTYIASVMGITMNRATPVFVEPDEFYNIDPAHLEEKITPRTKAILVVHLYGQASDMDTVMAVAKRHNLRVVEDCAQSHGACWKGKMTGTFGDVGCFSFYPSKNLGAFGDAGAIVTNDAKIAEDFRVYRNYGSEKRYYNKVVGTNSRLDELQAGLLRVRLTHLDELTAERRCLCDRYLRELSNPNVQLPKIREGADSVWHQFVVRVKNRQALIDYLNEKEIGTIIHYPIPPHLSEAYRYLELSAGCLPITEIYANEVLSLPLYNGMTEEEQTFVIQAINQ